MNAAVYDCALKSLVEVLENSFGAGASRVDVKLRTLTSGALELLFVDDGHGVTGELSAVYNAGYSTGEGRAAKEQNRMFHRGLVLCLDSLGADCHLFSQSRDKLSGGLKLQVSRYGPKLTELLEKAPPGSDRLPLQSVTTQLLPDGTLRQHGRPAHQVAGDALTKETSFVDVAALRLFIKSAFGERPRGPDVPGFGGRVVLRQGLEVTTHGDDLVQGNFSLRRFIKQRYAPRDSVAGMEVPECEVYLNDQRVPLAQWSANLRSPLYTRAVQGYALDLRMCVRPAGKGARSKYAPPSIRAVLAGTCIAVDVPSKSFETNNGKFFDQVETSQWVRRGSGDKYKGELDGHHRDGFTHLCALVSDSVAATKNGSKIISACIAKGGTQTPKAETLLEKETYFKYNRDMRALLGGDGVSCCVFIKPQLLGHQSVDASDMFTAQKEALKNDKLIREIRLLVHQAIVHWAPAAFKLKHPNESPQWKKVLEEEAEAEEAAAEAKAAQEAAAKADAEKAKTAKAASAAAAKAKAAQQDAAVVKAAQDAAAAKAARERADTAAAAERKAKEEAATKERAEAKLQADRAAAAKKADADAAATAARAVACEDDEDEAPFAAAARTTRTGRDARQVQQQQEQAGATVPGAATALASERVSRRRRDEPSDDDAGAYGGAGAVDDDDESDDDHPPAPEAKRARSAAVTQRLGGLQPKTCPYCSREMDASVAARAEAAAAKRDRESLKKIESDLRERKHRVMELEAKVSELEEQLRRQR